MRSIIAAGVCLLAGASMAWGAGGFSLITRRRVAQPGGSFVIREQRETWDAAKTAVIVCDMWDEHWCRGATRRVRQMVGPMNALLTAARKKGALIIHAPSDTMDHYRDHPARRRAQAAPPAANPPEGIGSWNRRLPAEKSAPWPVDQSDGGCDCRPPCTQRRAWSREAPGLEIADGDAVSDSGVEIWNLLAARGVRNVLLVGVHTNMCVVGRPFGLRNLAAAGLNVVLVRDLTDAMYNSRKAPFVSHFRGTELVIEYIEKYICPTTLSTDMTGAGRFRFPDDRRRRVVFVIAEREYHTWETLPAFAERILADRRGLAVELLFADPADRNTIPHLADALGAADLLFLSMRRRCLPAADLAAVRKYLAAGKPLVGIRTASHAFDTKGKHPPGRAEWRTFDPEVLGGNYKGHHGSGPKTTVTFADGAAGHPVLAGVPRQFTANGSLYRVRPLADSAKCLLLGRIPGKEPEPIAWTNTFGRSRVFYTSLGHPDDFAGEDPPIVRVLTNAVFWALGAEGPPANAHTPAAGR